MNLLPREVAERLRLGGEKTDGTGTLANWRVTGFGPKFIKCGKKVLYPLAEIEKWEQENLKANTAV